jgi:hypothetical protein
MTEIENQDPKQRVILIKIKINIVLEPDIKELKIKMPQNATIFHLKQHVVNKLKLHKMKRQLFITMNGRRLASDTALSSLNIDKATEIQLDTRDMGGENTPFELDTENPQYKGIKNTNVKRKMSSNGISYGNHSMIPIRESTATKAQSVDLPAAFAAAMAM